MGKNNLILILYSLALVNSCKSAKNASTYEKDKNNVVTTQSSGVNINSKNATTQIIFEGTNNIFEIVKHNTLFFHKRHDVIIIKGDNNIFKLYNLNIVDVSKFNLDTLIIVGNKERYVMLLDNEVYYKSDRVTVDSILINTPKYNFSKLEVNQDESYSHKIKYYKEEIEKGNIKAYYELAEIFNFGLEGAPIRVDAAIELYEYGVVNNDILSIRRLGDLWYNWEKNKIKGIYYYKLGAQLNDSYCIDIIKKSLNK